MYRSCFKKKARHKPLSFESRLKTGIKYSGMCEYKICIVKTNQKKIANRDAK